MLITHLNFFAFDDISSMVNTDTTSINWRWCSIKQLKCWTFRVDGTPPHQNSYSQNCFIRKLFLLSDVVVPLRNRSILCREIRSNWTLSGFWNARWMSSITSFVPTHYCTTFTCRITFHKHVSVVFHVSHTVSH